jgi:hypothetical protein
MDNTYTYDPASGNVIVQPPAPPTPAAYPFDVAETQAQVAALQGEIAAQQGQLAQYTETIAANVAPIQAQIDELTALLATVQSYIPSANQ